MVVRSTGHSLAGRQGLSVGTPIIRCHLAHVRDQVFVTSVAPIMSDVAQSHSFHLEQLGLPLE